MSSTCRRTIHVCLTFIFTFTKFTKIQTCCRQMCSFKLKMPQNPLGEFTTLPRPLVGWGGGVTPIPFSSRRLRHLDHGTFSASLLVPNTNFWLRHCLVYRGYLFRPLMSDRSILLERLRSPSSNFCVNSPVFQQALKTCVKRHFHYGCAALRLAALRCA